MNYLLRRLLIRLSIPLSTTYKYLQVFKNKQLLSKNDQTNQFYLGLTILKLGLLAAKKTPVMEIAAPYLKLLADRSLETAILVVGDGPNAICADIIESPRAVKFMTAKGYTMPLYAGAPGKMLLAFKDTSFIDQLIETTGLARLNKNTITDSEKLKRELADIRRQGYSESDSEFESDVCSVAAPIFDYKGQVIASISVAGPAERIFRENKERLIDLVKESAKYDFLGIGIWKNAGEEGGIFLICLSHFRQLKNDLDFHRNARERWRRRLALWHSPLPTERSSNESMHTGCDQGISEPLQVQDYRIIYIPTTKGRSCTNYFQNSVTRRCSF